MASKVILTGDVNLMNVADPAVPFRRIADELRAADVLFGNLECCLHVPSSDRAIFTEGFFADPEIGGKRSPCRHSCRRHSEQRELRRRGHHGLHRALGGARHCCTPVPGGNRAAARAPAVVAPQRGRAWGSCNAARSTGRPTTRRTTIHLALP